MATTTLSNKIQALIELISNYHPNHDTMMNIRGLIFDFGSVLSYSTTKYVRKLQETALCESTQKAFNLTRDETIQFLSQYHKLKMSFNERKLFLGTGTCLDEGFILEYTLYEILHDALININIDSNDINSSIINSLCISYRKPCVENARMIEGVFEFLEWCKNHDIRCGICSNYFDPLRTKQMLTKFGIKHFFDLIIISGDVKYRKPDYRIIEPIFKKWNDLKSSEIIFVGDNARRDILLSHYSNIRSILTRFTEKRRENTLPSSQKANEKLKFDSYVNLGRDVAIQCVSEEIGYTKAQLTVNYYHEIPDALYKISATPFIVRPLVVGLFILPHKINKFAKRNVFHMLHRRDIICKAIDFNKPLIEQGPFDIFIHKIASWYVAAKYDLYARKQLNDCLDFINQCKTNINVKLKGYNGEELKTEDNGGNGENIMFLTDNPENAKRTCDRLDMYNRIRNANIKINNVRFSAPEFVLIESDKIDLLKTDKNNELINCITLKLQFPIIAKPRLAVSPVFDGIKNLKSCAHTMYIIPSASMIYGALSSFKSENNERTDWILQNYINHRGCHKVYVVGNDVFVTVNDSTPSIDIIKNNIQSTFIDTGKFSKKPLKDQSSKKLGNVYKQISMHLSKQFELNCFGYDLLFDIDSKTNNGYIVDCNYLPGYKSVPNFSAVFWGFVLKQYFKFKNSLQIQ